MLSSYVLPLPKTGFMTLLRVQCFRIFQTFKCLSAILLSVLFFGLQDVSVAGSLPGNRVSDIQNTRHNFSAAIVPQLPGGQPRRVEADTESEICVFCHTPHAAEQGVSPLWNRKLSGATYLPYNSSSMDALPDQPNGSSKLCLSCHDGVLAIGAVNVLNATLTDQDPTTADIGMTIQGGGNTMPPGAGVTSGYTRDLGTDLTNDHPISFTFDTSLAQADGELRDPQNELHLGTRSAGVRPVVPLEQGQVQCISCHDPHIRSTNSNENIKFLRLNRLQKVSPITTAFDASGDIICLACHDKAGWVGSAHADDQVANEQYTDSAANLREFPLGTEVWESACLACHDTHAVQGSRRLLREGTDGLKAANGAKQGGNPAVEETCYACHSSDGGTLVTQGFNTEVPDIKSDFSLATHMPITSLDQATSAEVHDIGSSSLPESGKDFLESALKLGKGNLLNRHVECTDCHNPHRVIKNRRFNDDPATPAAAGTHDHTAPHSNVASGVLRGTWGVEPVYLATEFGSEPFDFQVKRGNPPINGLTDVNQSYVTREYQVCLKCHSNYAFDTPPTLGSTGGNTPYGTNGLTRYTNQAMEFQAPLLHKGEGTATGSGSAVGDYTCTFPNNIGGTKTETCNAEPNNHRGWHPVMANTGRTAAIRNMDASNFLEPFNDTSGTHVGNQTMYCSDCHGSNTANGTSAPSGGENGNPWGPHGSDNNFILKGPWGVDTGDGHPDHLCFKCHDYNDYAWRNNPAPGLSGFRTPVGYTEPNGCLVGFKDVNLHIGHAQKIGSSRFRCVWCHTAVPHGWKNKALLVNLNDVGPEAGLIAGAQVASPYTQEPYYLNAMLRIVNFAQSGSWTANDCGGGGGPWAGWMAGNCSNPP